MYRELDTALQEKVEKYITEQVTGYLGVPGSGCSTLQDHQNLIMHLRQFWRQAGNSYAEVYKRYVEARRLLSRMVDAYYREGHEDGPTVDEVATLALDWVSQEQLEDEIFESTCELETWLVNRTLDNEKSLDVDWLRLVSLARAGLENFKIDSVWSVVRKSFGGEWVLYREHDAVAALRTRGDLRRFAAAFKFKLNDEKAKEAS